MGRYTVEIKESAVKALGELPRADQRRVAARIDALADNPRPPGVEKLEGADDLYRVRAGDYRIIYRIADKRLVVLVIRTAARSTAAEPLAPRTQSAATANPKGATPR